MGQVIPLRRGSNPDGVRDSDEELVRRSAAGDRAALGELFDRHGRSVHRFLGRLTGWTMDLDDLVHATFLQALRSARRFRGHARVRTWLFGIAINVSREHMRSEARRRSFLDLWAGLPDEPRTQPDAIVEHQQLMTKLEDALGELPHAQRAAYLLCVVEELSGAEAAAALRIRPGTLGRRVHEARKALRAAIASAAR